MVRIYDTVFFQVFEQQTCNIINNFNFFINLMHPYWINVSDNISIKIVCVCVCLIVTYVIPSKPLQQWEGEIDQLSLKHWNNMPQWNYTAGSQQHTLSWIYYTSEITVWMTPDSHSYRSISTWSVINSQRNATWSRRDYGSCGHDALQL